MAQLPGRDISFLFILLPVATWLTSSFLSAAAWAPASWRPHLSRAASGASDAPCGMGPKKWLPINPDDSTMLRFQADEWLAFRSAYASRAHGQQLVFTQQDRPTKDFQRPWHVYEQRPRSKPGIEPSKRQQWVMVPTPLPAPAPTQLLAGAPRQAALFECTYQSQRHEHWTNIHRIMFLAQQHPLIDSVQKHKHDKAYDPLHFDRFGRATSFHQAPFRPGHHVRSLWRGDARGHDNQ